MKIDYQKTIDGLKEAGLISDGDFCAVCLFQAESESNGVTSTVTVSTVDYIMSANDEQLKLFEIDKKTGAYLDSYLVFNKADLSYGRKGIERKFIYASRGLFGGMYVAIHFIAEDFIHTYCIPKSLHGYGQKEARAALYAFVKQTYNTHYDKLKELYKAGK